MSRTDHARRPKIRGHRTSVRHVRLYGADGSDNGTTGSQSVCSCGLVGLIHFGWGEAHNDSRVHIAAVTRAVAS